MITSIETSSTLVNATNVKSQKNLFVFDTAFKSNKLTKMNFAIKSELKRSTMNINKGSSKVILSKKKRDKFRKIKSNDEIKTRENLKNKRHNQKNSTFIIAQSLM